MTKRNLQFNSNLISEAELPLLHKMKLDFKEKLCKRDWTNFSFNLASVITITSIAILARFLLAFYFRINYPADDTITNPWLRDVLFNPLNFEFFGFNDYSHYYLEWARAWQENNWYPYQWISDIHSSPLYNYSYPPLFLYILSLFWRPGMNQIFVALPLILSDSLCAGMVFLILRKIIKNENSIIIAFFGSMLLVIGPLNLIYNGVYWLNPGPVALFTLIAFYFAIQNKWWQAFFWLAVATMTKQNALFLAYPLFMAMLGSKLKHKSIKRTLIESIMNALLFVFICVAVSLPYSIITPRYFLYHLAVPGKFLSLDAIITEPGYRCITFSYALSKINAPEWLLAFFAFGVNSMFLMIFTSSVISVIIFWLAYKRKQHEIPFLQWIAIYLTTSHLFLPRGIFKFYTPYFMPFLLIALIISLSNLLKNKLLLAGYLLIISVVFIGSNIWILLIARGYFPLILAALCLIIGIFGLVGVFIHPIIRKRHLSKIASLS